MPNKKINILALDGGGIRGIIPATVMVHVEKRLKEFSKNPNAKIADYFDFIVGTSTGGILGCYYLVPDLNNPATTRFTAKQALDLYVEKGYEIFNASKKKKMLSLRQFVNATEYHPHNLEKIFLDQLGDLRFSELKNYCVVTTYEMSKNRAFFFCNVKKTKDNKNRDFLVRDVLRSTSAAPTYFPPAIIYNLNNPKERMVNIDGGVFANNPAMCAYAEVRHYYKEEKEKIVKSDQMMMLSIGTGGIIKSIDQDDDPGKWGLVKWAKATPRIMMNGSADTVNYQMKKLFEVEDDEFYSDNFIRVDYPKNKEGVPTPSYSADMADASPENIKKLEDAGQITVKEANENKSGDNGDFGPLDRFLQKIVSERLVV